MTTPLTRRWLVAFVIVVMAVLSPVILLLAGVAALAGEGGWAVGFFFVPGWWLLVGGVRKMRWEVLGC